MIWRAWSSDPDLGHGGALHAWTTGAMGVMTLAVMTRVTVQDLRDQVCAFGRTTVTVQGASATILAETLPR